MERDRDPRLEPLARRLRDRGRAPERDLWPGIEEAIDRRERAGLRPARTGWWRLAAAVAALLALVLLARDLDPRHGAPTGDAAAPALVAEAADAPLLDERAAIAQALAELGEAMAADPENPNLARLALMVHRSRGELLRRGSDSAIWTG
jgi:hypothetical protein